MRQAISSGEQMSSADKKNKGAVKGGKIALRKENGHE
jgi:hypothetical protein